MIDQRTKPSRGLGLVKFCNKTHAIFFVGRQGHSLLAWVAPLKTELD